MIPVIIALVLLVPLVYAFSRPTKIGSPPDQDWFFTDELWEDRDAKDISEVDHKP